MSHKKFSIQINKPCSQNWDEMTQQEKGRFCSHCTKVVVDFTAMTESQITAFFKNHTGKVCGRFYTSQLEYIYPVSLRKAPWYMNRFLQFAMSGLLTLKIADSTAQSPDPEKIQIKSTSIGENNLLPSLKAHVKKTIEGTVMGDYREAGLERTTVMINETGQSFETDSTGKFKFELPEDFKGKEFTIVFSHRGYQSESRRITVARLPLRKMIIHMENRLTIKGDTMYIPEK
jgi:hypothetical protein